MNERTHHIVPLNYKARTLDKSRCLNFATCMSCVGMTL
jgi:hypothetical protein